MKTPHFDLASEIFRPRLAWLPFMNFRGAALCGLAVLIGFSLLAGVTGAAAPAQNREVSVFTAADEYAPLVETVRDGSSFTPIAEMTGAGGLKWFMVKTKSGNLGWIKASDSAEAKKIDDHFRELPKDTIKVGPAAVTAGAELSTTTSTSEKGVITVPVKISGNKVVVPVTFSNGNSNVIGNLILDTGAGQTMVSKRMGRDLRLLAVDSRSSYGIGGSVRTEVGVVESMKVGDAEVKNIRVSIHDFSPDPSYEGLLGFDFLGRFQMAVNTEKQVMTLTPRKKQSVPHLAE